MQHYRTVENTMRPYPEIAANWAENGITPDKRLAFYCGTGWRASETWLYATLMGFRGRAVYDGLVRVEPDPVNNPIEIGDPTAPTEDETAARKQPTAAPGPPAARSRRRPRRSIGWSHDRPRDHPARLDPRPDPRSPAARLGARRTPAARRPILCRAAWAGLSDSMPRGASLSIHARVAGHA
jgi:hypothetical protein